MLPKANRLASGREIARIYRKGRSVRSDLFRVSWLPSSRGTRVAVVTSRKLSTKAVKRNLLKRQVRSLVAQLLPRLTRADIVVELLPAVIQQASAKRRDEARAKAGESLVFERLKAELPAVFERARLIGA